MPVQEGPFMRIRKVAYDYIWLGGGEVTLSFPIVDSKKDYGSCDTTSGDYPECGTDVAYGIETLKLIVSGSNAEVVSFNKSECKKTGVSKLADVRGEVKTWNPDPIEVVDLTDTRTHFTFSEVGQGISNSLNPSRFDFTVKPYSFDRLCCRDFDNDGIGTLRAEVDQQIVFDTLDPVLRVEIEGDTYELVEVIDYSTSGDNQGAVEIFFQASIWKRINDG